MSLILNGTSVVGGMRSGATSKCMQKAGSSTGSHAHMAMGSIHPSCKCLEPQCKAGTTAIIIVACRHGSISDQSEHRGRAASAVVASDQPDQHVAPCSEAQPRYAGSGSNGSRKRDAPGPSLSPDKPDPHGLPSLLPCPLPCPLAKLCLIMACPALSCLFTTGPVPCALPGSALPCPCPALLGPALP